MFASAVAGVFSPSPFSLSWRCNHPGDATIVCLQYPTFAFASSPACPAHLPSHIVLFVTFVLQSSQGRPPALPRGASFARTPNRAQSHSRLPLPEALTRTVPSIAIRPSVFLLFGTVSGVVLWQVLTRRQPFEGLTPIQAAFSVARQGLRPPLPPSAPSALSSLIGRCWHRSPDARPSFAQVCGWVVCVCFFKKSPKPGYCQLHAEPNRINPCDFKRRRYQEIKDGSSLPASPTGLTLSARNGMGAEHGSGRVEKRLKFGRDSVCVFLFNSFLS